MEGNLFWPWLAYVLILYKSEVFCGTCSLTTKSIGDNRLEVCMVKFFAREKDYPQ